MIYLGFLSYLKRYNFKKTGDFSWTESYFKLYNSC